MPQKRATAKAWTAIPTASPASPIRIDAARIWFVGWGTFLICDPAMTEPEIQSVEWQAIEAWLRTVPDQFAFDTIVGVARAGLPIAVALSYLAPTANLAVLERIGPRGAKPPCYDFEAVRSDRRKQLDATFTLNSPLSGARRIIVIDDVATYGDTLAAALAKVSAKAPDAEIRLCTYAVDTTRFASAHPELVKRLISAIDIDNSKLWVSFPWTLTPTR